MNPSTDLKGLLLEAYLLSEDVIKNSKGSVYRHINHPVFGDIEFPYIDEGVMGNLILKVLNKQDRLDEPFRGEVRRTKVRNETLGFLRITRAKKPGDITKFSIRIEESINTCWYRFVLLKELCQIYCDFEKDSVSDKSWSVESQVYDLLNKQRILSIEPDLFSITPKDDNYTEFLSFYMAINLVFPKTYWTSLKELTQYEEVDGVKKFKFKLYDIANVHKMPEFIVKLFVKEFLPLYESGGIPTT